MATITGLLRHLMVHAPGLSETNRQEYHELLDRLEEFEQAPPQTAPQPPAGGETPAEDPAGQPAGQEPAG